MRRIKTKWFYGCLAGMIILFSVFPQPIMAEEISETQETNKTTDDNGVPANDSGVQTMEDIEDDTIESVTVDTEIVDDELIAVEMPIIDEEYLLDFYIDPQNMIYRTCHIPGVNEVEEGAHLLFQNWEREGYAYSHNSDTLTVTNRSTVPILVTITAKIEDLGGIRLSDSVDFSDSDDCAIYLAITDDEGNAKALAGAGEVSLTVELDEAPDDAYVYQYDDESGGYEYAYLQNESRISFDSYSFWLTGESNASASWEGINAHPNVTVMWHIEPIMPEDEEEEVDIEATEETNKQDMEQADEEEIESESVKTESDEKLETETSDDTKIDDTDNNEESGGKGSEASENTSDNANNTDVSSESENEENEDADEVTEDSKDVDSVGTTEILEQEDTSDVDNTDEADNGSLDEG